MTTEQKNMMIAEFMEIELDDNRPCGDNDIQECYNTSWDWLMPVVEKIANDTQSQGTNKKQAVFEMLAEFHIYGISGLYEAVVAFIQWHNDNQGGE